MVGQVMGMSVLQGGPAPNFLSENLFLYLVQRQLVDEGCSQGCCDKRTKKLQFVDLHASCHIDGPFHQLAHHPPSFLKKHCMAAVMPFSVPQSDQRRRGHTPSRFTQSKYSWAGVLGSWFERTTSIHKTFLLYSSIAP